MTPADLTAHLHLWPQTAGAVPQLINLSENHTFLLTGATGARHILRIHRPGYQDQAAIQSELEWIAALRRDAGLAVPRPLAGRDGALIQTLSAAGGGTCRHAVLFAHDEGRAPEPGPELPRLFKVLGEYAARAHIHVGNWPLPAGFSRPRWDASAILDADGVWGNWRTSPGVNTEVASVLISLDADLRSRFAAYGDGADRFGLIHADMRLANLLVDGNRTVLIDFDDCGFGWFVYDFAAAVSFFEDDPCIPGLKARWLGAYRKIRGFGARDEAMLDPAILLRRMALLAWVGSHGETELARSCAPHFATGTAAMARRFLDEGALY